jgi:hypothetical protein
MRTVRFEPPRNRSAGLIRGLENPCGTSKNPHVVEIFARSLPEASDKTDTEPQPASEILVPFAHRSFARTPEVVEFLPLSWIKYVVNPLLKTRVGPH